MKRTARSVYRPRELRVRFETRRYRLARHSRNIVRETVTALSLICAIFTLSVLMITAFNYLISSPCFRIRETVVRGCRELTEKEVLALAAIKPAQTILTVNGDSIGRRVSSSPWVRSVAVGREFPDRLVLEVQERKAVALFETDQGLYLMDNGGAAFKRVEPGDVTDLPVITGCHVNGKTNRLLLAKSLELLDLLGSVKTFPTVADCSEIHCRESFGLSLFTTGGLCVKLGFDSYENRLKRLQPVLADLKRRNLSLRFVHIDLGDPTKVTVQRHNIAGPAAPSGAVRGTKTI
ncbi:MAG: FtsQ-type POTRA domain-containing protein [Deltaproteobacteria bacterium]|nr:FtsQ-type POTRA domain-containing protein [Deltaproteobacteria bacterium]